MLSFNQLKDRHDLPNWYFFRYLQLRHAFVAQFGTDAVILHSSPLEQLLCDESVQGTLSETYKELFAERPPALSKCREKWSSLVPNFQGDDLDDT